MHVRVPAQKPFWKAIRVRMDKGWETNNDAERHHTPTVGETASISIDHPYKEGKQSLQAVFFKEGHSDRTYQLLHRGASNQRMTIISCPQ